MNLSERLPPRRNQNTTMKNTTHTPGPWKYGQSTDQRKDGYVRAASVKPFAGAERPIAICKVCTVAPIDEVCANARLIAAAPELLDSIKALLADYLDAREAMVGRRTDTPTTLKVRAAIAKTLS